MKEKTLFRKSAIFVEVLITLQRKIQKDQTGKGKNLVRLVIRTTDKNNVRLGNVLDVDLKITSFQNVQIHQNIMRNGES